MTAEAPQKTCVACGGMLQPRTREFTEKRRPKFGLTWILVTIFTGGIGILIWLVWPRHKVVVGTDRYFQCSKCGAEQA